MRWPKALCKARTGYTAVDTNGNGPILINVAEIMSVTAAHMLHYPGAGLRQAFASPILP
jgi:hypothetical protein